MLTLKKAFTLVELLVVIGVLAVLMAGVIAIINPADRVKYANDSKAISDMTQIVGAVQAYAAANNGSYPAAANFGAVTAALVTSGDIVSPPTAATGWTYVANFSATAGKVAVALQSKKYTATPTFCWDTANNKWQYLAGAIVAGNTTCP